MEPVGLVSASLEGFRVLRRAPLTVLVWCAVTGVLMIWPLLLLMSQMLPMFIAMANATETQSNPEALPPEFFRFFVTFQLLNLLSIVGRLAWFAIFNAAVMRAVLRPQDNGRFYLKVGMEELWQAALAVIFYMGFSMVFVFAVFFAVALGFAVGVVWLPGGVVVGMAAGFAAAGAVLWLFLRLSMAFPQSFVDREFRLFESWKLTRGHAGGLFGMALCSWVFAVLIETAFMILATIVAIPFVMSLGLPTGGAEPDAAQLAAIVARLWPLFVGLAILLPPLLTLMTLATSAPWAEAYRRLTSRAPAESGQT